MANILGEDFEISYVNGEWISTNVELVGNTVTYTYDIDLAAQNTITIDETTDSLSNHRVIQRDSSDQGQLQITGTYLGNDPGFIDVQLKWADAPYTVVQVDSSDWTRLETSPTGGTFSGTLSLIPSPNHWMTVTARADYSGSTETDTTSNVFGVGVVVLFAGQSHIDYAFDPSDWDVATGADSLVRKFRHTTGLAATGISLGVAPAEADFSGWVTVTGVLASQFGNKLQEDLGCPIGLLDYGCGATALLELYQDGDYGWWVDTDDGFDGDTTPPGTSINCWINVAAGLLVSEPLERIRIGHMVWFQGHTDAHNEVSVATYVAKAKTLFAKARLDSAGESHNTSLPIHIADQQWDQPTSAASDAGFQNVRDAKYELADFSVNNYIASMNMDCVPAIDQTHLPFWSYAKEWQGLRLAQSVLFAEGDVTEYRGPTIESYAIQDATTVHVKVNHNAGTDIIPAATNQLFNWDCQDVDSPPTGLTKVGSPTNVQGTNGTGVLCNASGEAMSLDSTGTTYLDVDDGRIDFTFKSNVAYDAMAWQVLFGHITQSGLQNGDFGFGKFTSGAVEILSFFRVGSSTHQLNIKLLDQTTSPLGTPRTDDGRGDVSWETSNHYSFRWNKDTPVYTDADSTDWYMGLWVNNEWIEPVSNLNCTAAMTTVSATPSSYYIGNNAWNDTASYANGVIENFSVTNAYSVPGKYIEGFEVVDDNDSLPVYTIAERRDSITYKLTHATLVGDIESVRYGYGENPPHWCGTWDNSGIGMSDTGLPLETLGDILFGSFPLTQPLILTEYAADVNINISASATTDALTLTEYNVDVSLEGGIEATLDALTLTGYSPEVGLEVFVTATLDALTLTEYDATVNKAVNISATLDALTLAKYNTAIEIANDLEVVATLDTLTLTEYDTNANKGISFDATLDALTLTEYDVTVNARTAVDAAVDALTLTEYDTTVIKDIAFDASADALTLTEYNTTVTVLDTVVISATRDALTLTEFNPTVNKKISFDATLDVLTLTEYNTDVNIDISVTATIDALTLTEYNVAISVSDDINVTPNVDALTLTEHNPNVGLGIGITAKLDALTLVEQNPIISKDITFTATTDALTLTEHNANVNKGINLTTAIDALTLTEHNPTINVVLGVSATTDALTLTEYDTDILAAISLTTNVDALILTAYNPAVAIVAASGRTSTGFTSRSPDITFGN